MQRLIINADDYGYSKEINEGILEAHESGIVTSTTIMSNEQFFEQAIEHYPKTLGLGVHLNLTWGKSLATGEPFSRWNKYRAIFGLVRKEFLEKEFRKQIEKVLERGIKPDHLDSHHHLHAFSPIRETVLHLAREYNIGKVRWPKEASTGATFSMGYLKQRLIASKLKQCSLKTTDNFFGILYTKNPSLSHFISYLNFNGSAEICCHPGKASTNKIDGLAVTRPQELAILTNPQFKDEIKKRRIKLISFKNI